MLGDINSTNTGIWEQITKELLCGREHGHHRSHRAGGPAGRSLVQKPGRRTQRSLSTPATFLDRWVCSAEPRRSRPRFFPV
ncbi:MAG: hypothetical protein M0C28_47330 [Candidatus Moduliflexus flocculans]|nr:hypothetical protein [Candidatus Moduliflexus flocculans]